MRNALVSQLTAGLRILAVMTVALGVAYPLALTAFAQVALEGRADGSLVRVDGDVVGSELIAQPFTSPAYFHPRPSAVELEAGVSGASNLGPTSAALVDVVAARVVAYRDENGLDATIPVPVDAVTASGSGLDPDISPANARLQAPRVAANRSVGVDVVLGLVDAQIETRPLGFLGDDVVNVLQLNIALDAATGSP